MKKTVHDDQTNMDINFDGQLIGAASSHYADALRWTEVMIWKTTTNKWIIQKLGRTVVYHLPEPNGCKTKAGNAYGIPMPGDLLQEQHEPCPVCKPPFDPGELPVNLETDRSSVHICTTTGGVVESLLSEDSDGVTYMNKTASRALEEARSCDVDLRDITLEV